MNLTAQLVEEGRSIARYAQARRVETAAKIRDQRAMLAHPSLDGATPTARRNLRDYIRSQSARLAYRAPERLASRRDLVLKARDLRAWIRETRDRTDWGSLWCGVSDALGDRLDAAGREAAALRAYARTLRNGGRP